MSISGLADKLKLVCLDCGGPERKIRVGIQTYWFEDHPHMGPCPLNARTKEPLATTAWNSRHPFWEAHRLWEKQGKRIGDDGFCVWEVEKTEDHLYRHIGGKHWEYIPPERVSEATHVLRNGNEFVELNARKAAESLEGK